MKDKQKVSIDKDYCSSVVWCNGANWEESDFGFNEEQMTLSNRYSNLWESAHSDIENVNQELYLLAEEAKFSLLNNLYLNRKDIEWCYWDEDEREDVKYNGN